MAISYPISLPYSSAAKSRWTYERVAGMAESPFTRHQQATEWPGDILIVDITFPPLEREIAAPLVAALMSLDGVVGSFFWGPDGLERLPLGTAAGAPLVLGSGQVGKELITDGWSGQLKAGSWIRVAHTDYNRLYYNLKDTNAGGTFDIRPSLRTPSPADNAVVSFVNAYGTFRLIEPAVWDLDTAMKWGISFRAQEYLPGG